MIRIGKAILFGIALAGITLPWADAAPVRQRPWDIRSLPMFPDGQVHDFGKVAYGTQCHHTFRIFNNTDAPMRVEVYFSRCYCGAIRSMRYLGPTDLYPGQAGEIEIVLDTNRAIGEITCTTFAMANGREFRFYFRVFIEKGEIDNGGK